MFASVILSVVALSGVSAADSVCDKIAAVPSEGVDQFRQVLRDGLNLLSARNDTAPSRGLSAVTRTACCAACEAGFLGPEDPLADICCAACLAGRQLDAAEKPADHSHQEKPADSHQDVCQKLAAVSDEGVDQFRQVLRDAVGLLKDRQGTASEPEATKLRGASRSLGAAKTAGAVACCAACQAGFLGPEDPVADICCAACAGAASRQLEDRQSTVSQAEATKLHGASRSLGAAKPTGAEACCAACQAVPLGAAACCDACAGEASR